MRSTSSEAAHDWPSGCAAFGKNFVPFTHHTTECSNLPRYWFTFPCSLALDQVLGILIITDGLSLIASFAQLLDSYSHSSFGGRVHDPSEWCTIAHTRSLLTNQTIRYWLGVTEFKLSQSWAPQAGISCPPTIWQQTPSLKRTNMIPVLLRYSNFGLFSDRQ